MLLLALFAVTLSVSFALPSAAAARRSQQLASNPQSADADGASNDIDSDAAATPNDAATAKDVDADLTELLAAVQNSRPQLRPAEQQQKPQAGTGGRVETARPSGGRSKAESLRQWIMFVNWLYRRYQQAYGRLPTSTEAAHLMARYLPRYWKTYQDERYQSMRG